MLKYYSQVTSRTLIVQLYMPNSEYEDDDAEELHGVMEQTLKEDGKGATNTIIMGCWNSMVRDESYRNMVGPRGLERNHHRGQMHIDFCVINGLSIINTRFQKPRRRM